MQETWAQSAIDSFIAAFNAASDDHVPELLTRALTADVVFWGPFGRSDGIEAVERFVRDMRRHPDGPGTMTRCSDVDMPGEWARYRWLYRMPDGTRRLTGTDVVHLRRQRIDQMIVFGADPGSSES